MTAYPGDSWDIDPSYICEETISDDLGNEATIKVIHIRAEFDVDEENKATLVTFDGNGGVTNDAASQESVTESMPVNESFTMMGHTETGADAFVREGYTLVGWSFSQTTTADHFHAAIEANTSGGVINYDTLAHLGFFELDQTVAADNQWLTDDNNWDPLENTVYAIWEPHRFDVTIKKVVEGGDDQSKQFSFTTTGLERLTDNTSFTMTDGGRTTIENIPYGTAFTLSETPCAGFAVKSVTVTQTSDADGVPLEEGARITSDASDGATYEVKSDLEIVYTNARAAVPITVVKVDQQRLPLEGAQFAFEGTGFDGAIGSVTMTSTVLEGSTDAVIVSHNEVPVGIYVLSEVAPPDGYNALEGPVTINVGVVNGEVNVGATINGETTTFATAEHVDTNNPELGWVVTIMNESGVELPSAGGVGLVPVYAIGCLMVAAGVLTILRRRASA